MPSPRPYWKGCLKLSLVSCPIAVHAATSSSERVAFRKINRETCNRLKQQLVDDETGGDVEASNRGMGFEVSRHEYILVEDDELDTVAIESSHTIDNDRFVPRAQIDERYLDSPNYIVAEGKAGQDAFAVIREAMRGKDLIALGRIVVAQRERVVMLHAWDKGHHGDDPALRLRSGGRSGLLQRHRRPRGAGRHAGAGRAHPRQ